MSRSTSHNICGLSDEILVRIFSFLTANDLCRCSRVCVSWCRLSNDFHLWRDLFIKKFGKFIIDQSFYNRLTPTQWKEQYIIRANWFSGHCHVQKLHQNEHKTLPHQSAKITCLRISKCSQNLLASAKENSRLVHVWDLVEKRCKHVIHCDGVVCAVDFGSLTSRNLLAVGLSCNKFSIWDVKQELFRLHQTNITESAAIVNPALRMASSIRPLHESAVVQLNLVDDKLATVTQDCVVRVWLLDLSHTEVSCLHTLTTLKPRCSVLDVQLQQKHHSNTWSVSISHAAEVMENWNLIGFQSVKFDGRSLSGDDVDNSVMNSFALDRQEAEKYILEKPDEPMTCRTTISCLSISPCTRLVASGQTDNTICLWDTHTRRKQHNLFGHTGSVTCTAVDSHKVVSGSNDRTVKVWSLDSGHCQLTLPEDHSSGVSCVTFSDQWVVSGDSLGEIKVWDFAVSSLSVLREAPRAASAR
ncbi:F-box/WD repeat-containing protein 7 isoform X2 [Nematostella vectensis]|uniref:F-box/WD repeat-containing protein 7 isoform X2 n=1 Tax=Nematostella vectensis TaxID=45351 RepID=UPI0020770BB9|nr:F-box/WD repeat-containing protein 7 isoform X2 [Nematostella vectensis]